MRLKSRDVEAVSELWRDLGEFPASRPREALEHCMERLTEIVGACNVSWMAAIQESQARPDDPMGGWSAGDIAVLHDADAFLRRHEATLKHFKKEDVDPQSAAMVARAGTTTRAVLRAALVDDATWERSWLYQEVLRPLGIEDRLVGAFPISPTAESYFALDRTPGDPPFDDRARDVLHLFLSGCPLFHDEQLRVRGLLDALEGLTPRERSVLKLLLTGLSEREMADALDLSFHTVHEYVISVYRKFGVHSRPELTARWLRSRPPIDPSS